MNVNLIEFKTYCQSRGWKIDRFTSEFTLQFRLCRFLETLDPNFKIELESNINRYQIKGLSKKEIDIDLLNNSERVAIELKYIRDQGSYNIGMFNSYVDIKFIEELIETNEFQLGYCIIFSSLPEVYNTTEKALKPRNTENLPLYLSFKKDKILKGKVQIKTGNMNRSVKILGSYSLNWIEFQQDVKACVIKIK